MRDTPESNEDAPDDRQTRDPQPHPSPEPARPELPDEVPEDWLDQKPFDPSGR
jgi:hypothetical protein